jgi:hypothetical protein
MMRPSPACIFPPFLPSGKGSCATVSWKDGMPKHAARLLAKLPREWERFGELRRSPVYTAHQLLALVHDNPIETKEHAPKTQGMRQAPSPGRPVGAGTAADVGTRTRRGTTRPARPAPTARPRRQIPIVPLPPPPEPQPPALSPRRPVDHPPAELEHHDLPRGHQRP